MKEKTIKELVENKRYLFIVFVISLLTILPNIILSPSIKVSIVMVISIFILVLISKFSKTLFIVFIFYINISNIFIGHTAIHWGYKDADITPRLYAVSLSPAYESIEYLNNYLDYRDLFFILYILFVIYLIYKYITVCKHTFSIVRKVSFVLTVILVSILTYIPFNISKTFEKVPYRFNKEPFNIPVKCLKFWNEPRTQELLARKEYMSHAVFNIDKNATTLYDKVIVVIGESVNKNHMDIYGYDKKTTPFLTSLKDNKNLFNFNVIAPTNQTRYSVPILLTEANVEDYVNLYTCSPSIIKDFYMQGYKTSWISNQGHVGKHDNSISIIGEEADKRVFFNKGDYKKAKTDESIVEYLSKEKQDTHKELTVIHLMGSHFAYAQRYTKEHVLYKNAKNVVEEYDNSIYFTDYVLENIYKHYSSKNEKVLFIYFSDHGEVMANDGKINKIGGHGFNPAYKDEYEVPFVVYSSIDNPRLNKLLEKNKEHYFNMENLNYMIEYISGIRDDDNISYSSKVFTLEPKNIVDYEKLKYYQ